MALQNVQNYGLPFNISATGLVYTGPGNVIGVVVNSNTGGSLKLWDNTLAATTVLFNTITFGTNEHFIDLFGAKFTTGLFATIGGTADLTIIYNPKNG